MKTSINLKNILLILTFLLLFGTGFGQKSLHPESVGANLEEIKNFLHDTCQSLDKISRNVVDDLKTFSKEEKQAKAIREVTDWSEVQMNDLYEAAREAKLWLSKQYFSPVTNAKQTKNTEKRIN